jgi:hypothetical protein
MRIGIMATFITHKIMGTALQITERYTDLQARDVGAFGVIWYISSPYIIFVL